MNPDNGLYVSAEASGKKSLRAVRPEAKTWETFLINFNGQYGYLTSVANNKIVATADVKTLKATKSTDRKRGLNSAFQYRFELVFPSDSANCGDINIRCQSQQFCQLGQCQCPSDLPQTCGAACVNRNNDTSNCGVCGNTCGSREICQSGSCVCPTTTCSGQCVDTNNDNNNCGVCNRQCGVGKFCQSGQCVCSAPTRSCSGGCVDTARDNNNCGACGNKCVSGYSCTNSQCTCTGPFELNSFSTVNYLAQGQSIFSQDCTWRATLGTDGNFATYKNNAKRWSTSISGNWPNSKIYMQLDGNLVIYNSLDAPTWASNTYWGSDPQTYILKFDSAGILQLHYFTYGYPGIRWTST